MILSRTMRPGDFAELAPEIAHVDSILGLLNGGDKAQHPMRRWEYAMALRAFDTWNNGRAQIMRISDHGCCTGMLAPMMFHKGMDISLYEVWSWGNQQEYATRQMEMVRPHRSPVFISEYRWINKPLGGLDDTDRNFDVSFCISTMEHIPPYEEAFRDLCRTVRPGGMLFITSDSAEDEHDHYSANNVRGGRMFNKDVYERLAGWGREEGFELMGGESDWSWDESCRMVNDYGFACLAMVRA